MNQALNKAPRNAPSNALTRKIIAAIAVAIAVWNPACSQATEVVASTRVSYADLNLSNSADVHTLYRRLSKAADRVCPEDSVKAHQACVLEALGDAVRRANLIALSTLYSKDTGMRLEPASTADIRSARGD